VVERRQASASRWTRGRIRSMRLMEVRLPAFRFLFFFRGLSEHDRAENRFHRRFRRDAILL
jgi:hypothetical protein